MQAQLVSMMTHIQKLQQEFKDHASKSKSNMESLTSGMAEMAVSRDRLGEYI